MEPSLASALRASASRGSSAAPLACFFKKLEADLVPGSSMVLAYIRSDTLVDTQQFLDAISHFRGTVCQTTVSDEVEQVIMKQQLA